MSNPDDFAMFYNAHKVKNCKSKYRYQIDNCTKRHHYLIHIDKELKSNQLVTKEIPNDSITCNKVYDKGKQNNSTFLQILPINVSNFLFKCVVRLGFRFHFSF